MANYSIGILAAHIDPNLFGSSRNIYYLAKALEEKGCQVTVFCPDSQANKEAQLKKIYVPGSKCRFIPRNIPVSFKIARRAKKREGEFDIFHSNCALGFPYAFRRNKPLVVHLRDIPLRTLQAAMVDSLFKTLPLYKKLYMLVVYTINWLAGRYITKNSDLVFCNSKETAIAAKRMLGAESSKIRVVYNGVDTDFFLKGDGEGVRKAYGLEDKKVLVCVTRLTLTKGIDRLLSAMEIIAERRRDIALLLVGGGDFETEVRAGIIKRGLSDSVISTGHIADKHLADFYRSADLFVYPCSPGSTLVEAMAAQKPFILYYRTKDVPAGVPLDEIVDRKLGRIIKDEDITVFAEEILNYIDDNEWLSAQGEKGLQFVKQELSWDKIAEQVIGYYEQVM